MIAVVFFGILILFIAIGNIIKMNMGKEKYDDVNHYFNKNDDDLFKDNKDNLDTISDPIYSNVPGNIYNNDNK